MQIRPGAFMAKVKILPAPWQPVRFGMERTLEVMQMAADLKLDPYAVVGRLLAVWAWAGTQSVDGKVVAEPVVVDTLVGVYGFASAMGKIG